MGIRNIGNTCIWISTLKYVTVYINKMSFESIYKLFHINNTELKYHMNILMQLKLNKNI